MMNELNLSHFEWWYGLEENFRKVLLITIYDKPEYYVDFYDLKHTKYTDLKRSEHLLKIFELKQISYMNDIPSNPEYTLTKVPSFEFFHNLECIEIVQCDLEDLSGFQTAKHAKRISIHENWLSDNQQLQYFNGLTELEELDLSFNALTDLSALHDLPNLKEISLCCYYNDVNVASLVKFPALEIIDMDTATDITILGQLTQLKSLDYGSDEREFDCSKIEWLIEQLPQCQFNFYLPNERLVRNPQGLSDINFLHCLALRGMKKENVRVSVPKFANEVERFNALEEKYRNNNEIYPLLCRAREQLTQE
ncbi:leucine-rich repeat domain-containing protein [Gallibacterium melopsittaci]|uniref:Leucine-rich repeat domain-containing protein n=1 Tax=Gallibacterium melopsittaci TaxID=516063 RepID=A0ABV6HYN8_9PAST